MERASASVDQLGMGMAGMGMPVGFGGGGVGRSMSVAAFGDAQTEVSFMNRGPNVDKLRKGAYVACLGPLHV